MRKGACICPLLVIKLFIICLSRIYLHLSLSVLRIKAVSRLTHFREDKSDKRAPKGSRIELCNVKPKKSSK